MRDQCTTRPLTCQRTPRPAVLALYLTFASITLFGGLLIGVMMDAWSAPDVLFGWCAAGTALMVLIMVRSARLRAL